MEIGIQPYYAGFLASRTVGPHLDSLDAELRRTESSAKSPRISHAIFVFYVAGELWSYYERPPRLKAYSWDEVSLKSYYIERDYAFSDVMIQLPEWKGRSAHDIAETISERILTAAERFLAKARSADKQFLSGDFLSTVQEAVARYLVSSEGIEARRPDDGELLLEQIRTQRVKPERRKHIDIAVRPGVWPDEATDSLGVHLHELEACITGTADSSSPHFDYLVFCLNFPSDTEVLGRGTFGFEITNGIAIIDIFLEDEVWKSRSKTEIAEEISEHLRAALVYFVAGCKEEQIELQAGNLREILERGIADYVEWSANGPSSLPKG